MRLEKLEIVLSEFAMGILSGFPICCVLNWSFDSIIHREDQRIKRHISGLSHRGYVPCVLCMWSHKQTHQRAITEMFLESGFLDDADYWLLPKHVKALVLYPPKL
jgi:hypothetical protein